MDARVKRVEDHSCHILPLQPILWNKYFPPEPANTAKHSPKSISAGEARRGSLDERTIVQTSELRTILL